MLKLRYKVKKRRARHSKYKKVILHRRKSLKYDKYIGLSVIPILEEMIQIYAGITLRSYHAPKHTKVCLLNAFLNAYINAC